MRRIRPLDAQGLASRRAARLAAAAVAVALLLVAVLAFRPRPVPPPKPPPPPPAPLRVGPADGPALPTRLAFVRYDGRPAAAGALLLALGEDSPLAARRLAPSADGSLEADFEFAGTRGRLVVVPDEADLGVAVFELGPDAPPGTLRILPAGSEAEGVLVDPRGRPQPGFWVGAEIEVPPAEGLAPFAHPVGAVQVSLRGGTLSVGAFADDAGRFRIPGVPASAAGLAVRGKSRTERYLAGRNLRLILPDGMER